MKEIDTAGLCCPKNWMFELSSGPRNNEKYRFYACDPVMFTVRNSVVSLIIDNVRSVNTPLSFFIEKFEILPYRYVKSHNGNDKKKYKMFSYQGNYFVENNKYQGEFDTFNPEQFKSFFDITNYYYVCQCTNDTTVKLDNGQQTSYHKGEYLPFMMDNFNRVKVGVYDKVSTWDFSNFIQYFSLQDNMKEYEAYMREFGQPFFDCWKTEPNNLFDSVLEELQSIPNELIEELKDKNLLVGTDPDGGVVGERGDDGMEVLKHTQEIEEGILEIKTNMLR